MNGIRPVNPVFDVDKVNRALIQVNKWISSETAFQAGEADLDREFHMTQQARPGEEAFFAFMGDMVDRISLRYDFSEEESVGAILDVIDIESAKGMLDPMPGENDPDIAYSMFMGQATTIKLEAMVCQHIELDEAPFSERGHLA